MPAVPSTADAPSNNTKSTSGYVDGVRSSTFDGSWPSVARSSYLQTHQVTGYRTQQSQAGESKQRQCRRMSDVQQGDQHLRHTCRTAVSGTTTAWVETHEMNCHLVAAGSWGGFGSFVACQTHEPARALSLQPRRPVRQLRAHATPCHATPRHATSSSVCGPLQRLGTAAPGHSLQEPTARWSAAAPLTVTAWLGRVSDMTTHAPPAPLHGIQSANSSIFSAFLLVAPHHRHVCVFTSEIRAHTPVSGLGSGFKSSCTPANRTIASARRTRGIE